MKKNQVESLCVPSFILLCLLVLFHLPQKTLNRILHLHPSTPSIPVIDMPSRSNLHLVNHHKSSSKARHLKLKSYIDSGSIKLGEGDYFDSAGKRIKKKPKEMEEVEPPRMKDDRDDQTVMLQMPNTFMSEDWKKQKPIIFVPEVLYPNIKKRVIMHHYAPMMQVFRNNVFHSVFYQSFLKNNPFYKDILANSSYQKNIEENPYFKKFIDDLHKEWKY